MVHLRKPNLGRPIRCRIARSAPGRGVPLIDRDRDGHRAHRGLLARPDPRARRRRMTGQDSSS